MKVGEAIGREEGTTSRSYSDKRVSLHGPLVGPQTRGPTWSLWTVDGSKGQEYLT